MKFKHLLPGQKLLLEELGVLNGCGPGDWRIHFDWFFRASCFEHDWNYAVGGTEADRRWADWGFYQAMKKDTIRLAWYKKPYARLKAWLCYTAVRLGGKRCFHYGEPRSYESILSASTDKRS